MTVTDSTGSARDIVTLSSPIRWDDRDHIQTLCTDDDSERTASDLMANTMDASPVGISIADARRDDDPLIYVNDGFLEITGYPREEVLGRTCRFLQGDNTRDEPATFVVLERYEEETGHGAVEATAALCRGHADEESPTSLGNAYEDHVFRVKPLPPTNETDTA